MRQTTAGPPCLHADAVAAQCLRPPGSRCPCAASPRPALPSTHPGQQGASGCSHAQQHHSGGAGMREANAAQARGGGAGFSRPQGATAQQGARSHSQQPRAMGWRNNRVVASVSRSMDSKVFWGGSRCWDGLLLRTQRIMAIVFSRGEWPARAAFGSVVFYLSKGWPLRSQGLALRCAVLPVGARRRKGAARWLRCSHCAVIIEYRPRVGSLASQASLRPPRFSSP